MIGWRSAPKFPRPGVAPPNLDYSGRMMVPQTVEYALRAMSCLSGQAAGVTRSAREVAESTKIPPTYASKILRQLVAAGLLISEPGRSGGYRLAKAAQDIRFYDVFVAMDYTPGAEKCAFGWDECDLVEPCPLHHAWRELSDTWVGWSLRMNFGQVQGCV